MEDRVHKAHRPAQSGSKAEKKGKAKEKQHGFNEKVLHLFSLAIPASLTPSPLFLSQAFAPKSGRRADRQGRRAAEKDQTRECQRA